MLPTLQPTLGSVFRTSRRVDGQYDVTTDGINPSLTTLSFTLDSLPNFTDFTNLFQFYRIARVDLSFRPEYTELTDAALVSNAVNVSFNSAVWFGGTSAPTSVNVVRQNNTCSSTMITRNHTRKFTPLVLMDGNMPCSCRLTTQTPSVKHFGLQVGVDPTGVAMVFRATVVIHLELSGAL